VVAQDAPEVNPTSKYVSQKTGAYRQIGQPHLRPRPSPANDGAIHER